MNWAHRRMLKNAIGGIWLKVRINLFSSQWNLPKYTNERTR